MKSMRQPWDKMDVRPENMQWLKHRGLCQIRIILNQYMISRRQEGFRALIEITSLAKTTNESALK